MPGEASMPGTVTGRYEHHMLFYPGIPKREALPVAVQAFPPTSSDHDALYDDDDNDDVPSTRIHEAHPARASGDAAGGARSAGLRGSTSPPKQATCGKHRCATVARKLPRLPACLAPRPPGLPCRDASGPVHRARVARVPAHAFQPLAPPAGEQLPACTAAHRGGTAKASPLSSVRSRDTPDPRQFLFLWLLGRRATGLRGRQRAGRSRPLAHWKPLRRASW